MLIHKRDVHTDYRHVFDLNDRNIALWTEAFNDAMGEPVWHLQVDDAYGPLFVPINTVVHLKEKFGFVYDAGVAAAHNSGQKNTDCSASAVLEGTIWSAEPGNYYCMSRNWAGNNRLTIEVSRTSDIAGSSATRKGALLNRCISHPILS